MEQYEVESLGEMASAAPATATAGASG
jgi:hypothetical protein